MYGEGGSDTFIGEWEERNPDPSLSWHLSTATERVSFTITSITSREGGNEVYVAGIQSDGTDVIEKWIFSARKGGYHLVSQGAQPQPIGTPMPAYSSFEVLEGGVFLSPPPIHTGATRAALYRGSAMGHIRAMVCDPEGRFLIALTTPAGDLYRVHLVTNPGTVELLVANTQVPALQEATTMQYQHHATEGRKVVLTQAEGSVYPLYYKNIVLSDADNDGVFESISALDHAAWLSAGYEDDSNWATDYDTIGSYAF
jgi:hypothetical protein